MGLQSYVQIVELDVQFVELDVQLVEGEYCKNVAVREMGNLLGYVEKRLVWTKKKAESYSNRQAEITGGVCSQCFPRGAKFHLWGGNIHHLCDHRVPR